jgi:hypothetical protein
MRAGIVAEHYGISTNNPTSGSITRFDIKDSGGTVIAVHVRRDHTDGKQLWWEGPDGTRGLGGRRVETLPLDGIHKLPEELTDQPMLFVEGEPARRALTGRGVPAVGTVTGARTIPSDDSLRPLLNRSVVLWPDNDADGRQHMERIAARLRALGHHDVRWIIWTGGPEAGDAVNFFEEGGTVQSLQQMISAAAAAPHVTTIVPGTPWSQAQAASEFVTSPTPEHEWIMQNIVAPGAITEFFSPRGIGKTQTAHAIAVELAKRRLRVLIIDRDNPRSVLRKRLQGWGAGPDTTTLKILSREQAPPLTDKKSWDSFPFGDYDVVILDALDAAAEGMGEKDSAKPSQAIAPLLDIAHRDGGPAILVLGNTIKSGARSRGNGVIEDRADICYEIRDATNFTPIGRKPWWLELPAAGAEAWGERADRRGQRRIYRLAFVPTKFRLGEEPAPFMLEINLTTQPWTLADVTDALVHAGTSAQKRAEVLKRERWDAAAGALVSEIVARTENNNLMLKDRDALPFLERQGLSRDEARSVLEQEMNRRWWAQTLKNRRGQPVVLRTMAIARKPVAAAEIPQSETVQQQRGKSEPISAASMDTGPWKSAVEIPVQNAAIRDGRLFSRAAYEAPPSALQSASSRPRSTPVSIGPEPAANVPRTPIPRRTPVR